METAKVEEVVEDFVNLKRRGANMLGLCPFHHEKTPSFTVSPSKNLYKCFGCGKAGNAVGFVMEHESMSYPEALRYLAQRYNIEIEETQTSQEHKEERRYIDSLFIVNDYAKAYYEDQLFNTDTGKSVGLHYFKERGFREETIKSFGLGYAPAKKDAFTLKATQDGHTLEMLKKLGLTSEYGRDFFRGRVMFTLHNLSGKVVGFAGRIMQKDVKAPKYINSPETEVYLKSKFLYGAHQARKSIRKLDECIMVEGYTDVISLHQAGIENVVASSGTSLTVEQIGLVKRYTPNIKILYDGDAAGVKAALRGLDLVLEQDLNVKVVLLPTGEDPDSYLQKVGTTAFKEYIDSNARDFIFFKTDLLMEEAAGDPIKKTRLIKDIVGSIARIPDPIKRSLYVKECAFVMQVEESILVEETNRTVTEMLRKKRQRRQRGEEPREQNQREQFLKPVEQQSSEAQADNKSSQTAASPTKGVELQEREIVRVLISHAGKIFDAEENLTVEAYVLSNIQEVIDEFQHELYQQVVRECLERTIAQQPLSTQYFVNHSDQKISRLAIDLLQSPFEYSPNWIELHNLPLQNQLDPEENFKKDSINVVFLYKIKKADQMMIENQERIRKAQDSKDHDKIMTLLRVQQKLSQLRNELAAQFQAVVLK